MADIYDYVTVEEMKSTWDSLNAEQKRIYGDNYDSFVAGRQSSFNNMIEYGKISIDSLTSLDQRIKNMPVETDDKASRAWNLVSRDLESLGTFEQKQKYITGHKYIKRAMDKLPGFKEMVNSHMIESITSEFGNPDAPGFTFSQKYSDEFLLDKLNLIEKNTEVFEDYFGGKEGIKELEAEKLEGDIPYKEASEKIKNIRQAIKQKRREFDDRSQSFGGPAGVFTVPLQAMKPVVQILAGWTDPLFQQEGLEQVENRKFDWDPLNKRYGPGPEIPALQEELRGLYTLRNDTLPKQYHEVNKKYAEYKDLILSDESNRTIVNSTGIDEALNYLDTESLKLMLQGG